MQTTKRRRIASPQRWQDALTRAFLEAVEVRQLSALSKDALQPLVKAWLKEDRSVILISHTGSIVSLPTRFGVRPRDKSGKRERWFTLQLWWEMPWDWVVDVVAMLLAQRERLSIEAEALQEVLALREHYPETKTPKEACDLAGIDPRSIDLRGLLDEPAA